MHESWMLIVGAVFSMLCVIGVGALARRLGWLTEDADQSLLKLIIRVFMPCLVVHSVLGNEVLRQANNVLVPPLVGFAVISLGLAVVWIVAQLGYPVTGLADARQRRTFVFTTAIFNYGYLAIPLVEWLFGRKALGVLFVHNIGAELAFWTVGALMLRGKLDRNWWKQVLNPPSVAILGALALNTLDLGQSVPQKFTASLATGINWLGQATVPLALVLIGATIADELRPNSNAQRSSDVVKWIGWACLLRLGALPLLMLFGAFYLPLTDELKRVLAVQAAMPSGVFSIIMARVYGGSPGVALRVALFTSLVSLFTIPLWIPLGIQWLGLAGAN